MNNLALRSTVLTVAVIMLTATSVLAQPRFGSLLTLDPGLTLNLTTLGLDPVEQPASAGFSLGTLGQKLERSPVGVGLNVAPLRQKIADDPTMDRTVATSLYRLIDTDIRTTAIGLDLKLRWPSFGARESASSPLQPYVSVGPALLVSRGDEAGWLNTGLLNRQPLHSDVGMSVGMKSALGLTWQLTKDASLFGEYRLIQDRFGLPGRAGADRDHSSADLFYGFSLRF